MLQEAQPDGKIFDAVDSFFPEGDAAPAAGHAQAVSNRGVGRGGDPALAPRPDPALQTPQELAMVAEAQESFRDLVLALLADRGRRAAYLQVPSPRSSQCLPVPPSASQYPQGPARQEYGEPFLEALEHLFYEYLQRVESALPPPDLRQVGGVGGWGLGGWGLRRGRGFRGRWGLRERA